MPFLTLSWRFIGTYISSFSRSLIWQPLLTTCRKKRSAVLPGPSHCFKMKGQLRVDWNLLDGIG